VKQTMLPKKIIVVNDNSTDSTCDMVTSYTKKYDFIDLISTNSSKDHMPGSKVINAFYQGFKAIDTNYDIICKFDADLIFPSNYLEKIILEFKKNSKTGMVGGFCYIQEGNDWNLENLTNKDHIRGALKAYRKECFKDIGGLKPAMGWDTVDELLAQFHNWHIVTDESLHVKHLKPTGHIYNPKAKYKQGEAFYSMRYGIVITLIASIKLALRKKNPALILDYLRGYLKGKRSNKKHLVSVEEGKFIRQLRWKKIRKKLF